MEFGNNIQAPQATAEGEAVVLGGSGTIPQDLLPETSGGGGGWMKVTGPQLYDYLLENLSEDTMVEVLMTTGSWVSTLPAHTLVLDVDVIIDSSSLDNIRNLHGFLPAYGFVSVRGFGTEDAQSYTFPSSAVLSFEDALAFDSDHELSINAAVWTPTGTQLDLELTKAANILCRSFGVTEGGGSTSSDGGWQIGTGSSGS